MSDNTHYFETMVAKEVGVVPAVIYQNLAHWVNVNKSKNVNFYDGYYWTYNSVKSFSEIFDYLTERQIRTALEKLEKLGFIKSGNYNEMGYDRTKWYTLTRGTKTTYTEELPFDTEGNGGLTDKSTPFDRNVEPIPDINTDINTDIKDIVELGSTTYPFKEIIDYLNEKTNSNYRPSVEKNKKLIRARINEGFTLDDFKTVIDKKTKEWKDDKAMCIYLRPETLFGTKFEGYLNQKGATDKQNETFDGNDGSQFGIVL